MLGSFSNDKLNLLATQLSFRYRFDMLIDKDGFDASSNTTGCFVNALKPSRRESVGASEIGALFGCSPFQSEYSLWALKTGLIQEQEDNERLRAGRFLEEAILNEFNRINKMEITYNAKTYTHDRHPLSATPDGIWRLDEPKYEAMKYGIVADVKTVGPHMHEKWENGTPEYIKLQIQQQMLVLGAQRGLTIAMFGFSDPRHEWIERDESIHAEIIKRIETFWKRVTGELPPPEVDGHRATTAALKKRVALSKSIQFDEGIREYAQIMAEHSEKIKVSKQIVDEMENRIIAAMGNAEVGLFADGTGFNIKTIQRKAYEVKANSYQQLKRIKNKEAL